MKINEILIEREMPEYTIGPDNRYDFTSHRAFVKAQNSNYAPIRAGAEEFAQRNPPRGKFWPEKWNANALAVIKSRQDRNNSELTTTKPPQEKPQYIVRRDANKVSTADISKPMQEPMQVARPELPVAKPKPTMPMGGIAGVIRRKKQK